MADKRIYDLTTITDATGYYVALDKSGDTEASKFNFGGLITLVNAKANTADVYNKSVTYTKTETQTEIDNRIKSQIGTVVYSATIYEEGEGTVNPISDITVHANDNGSGVTFITNVRKEIEDYYYLQLRTTDTDFFDSYIIQVKSIKINTNVYNGLRFEEINLSNDGGSIRITFRDASYNRQPSQFQVQIIAK